MQVEGTISLLAMTKASRVVKDFVVSFFPLLDLPLTRYLDMSHVLLWAESAVYTMDFTVERAQRRAPTRLGVEPEVEVLTAGLRSLGLLTPQVSEDVSRLVRYFELETELLASGSAPSIERLREVWGLRSSDVRLLASITAQLAGMADSYHANVGLRRCIDGLMRCVEVVADAADYEADEEADSFNTLRMFARIYGHGDARQRLVDELGVIRGGIEAAAAELAPDLRERVLAAVAAWWGRVQLPTPAPAPESTGP